MSSLTAIFGSSEEKGQDSDKLMDLYWNRAELKKEFAGMRKEQFRLQDVIKTKEGETARLQQRLDHLESLLTDPELADSVLVYYQLRGLGQKCARKLAKFAEELKQQREQKQHSSLMGDWKEALRRETKGIELEMLEKRDAMLQLEDQLQAEQRRLTTMNSWTRFFRGKGVMRQIDAIADQLELAAQEEQMINERREEIQNREPPDQQGLDIAAKRSINLMILAYSQQLYVHFADADIVDLIKEATEKSVGAINYGSRKECAGLLGKLTNAMESLEQATEFADVLQKRVQMLGGSAKFSSAQDAVPLATSVAQLIRVEANGLVRETRKDLLGENYWGIAKVFSR